MNAFKTTLSLYGLRAQYSMQPPLPLGTCLQNRYRLIKILGQGGFGRTYLAEDQGRFNERCALKEWIPPQSGPDSFRKSKELFEREAAVLYQKIQHPQIPKFHATLQEDGRLFLVQDYVAGKTYRALLDERRSRRSPLSEAEVRQLIDDLLPVLDYLHGIGIIHRDISPDNVILRDKDQLPVLIDFGVVKEVATRLQFSHSAYLATSVGKLGYAPSEQLQTGQAYPSSDLYALAVTAIVLMTGREPQELFDPETLTWNWQTLTSTRPSFAHVLNRMLSQRPSDRYASSQAVMQALRAVPGSSTRQMAQSAKSVPPVQVSDMRTVEVGRRSAPRSSGSNHQPSIHRDPASAYAASQALNTPERHGFWENPWMLVPTGLVVAILSGFGAWAVVNTLIQGSLFPSELKSQGNQNPDPQSPIPTPTLTPKPLPPQVVQQSKLSLAVDQPLTREGTLTSPLIYRFTAEAGQLLTVRLEGGDVRMAVLGPNQEPVDNQATGVQQWQGTLAASGEYAIRLSPTPDVSQSSYKLDILLNNPAPPTPDPTETPLISETPLPTPTSIEGVIPIPIPTDTLNPQSPIPTPESSPTTSPTISPSPASPAPSEESLILPPGRQSLKVSGQTSAQNIKTYLVNGREAQNLTVEVLNGPVTLEVRDPADQPIDSNVLESNQTLSSTGTYKIRVLADQSSDFTLRIKIKD